jgi:hypothetical protein
MTDFFKYYKTLKRDMPKISTYFSWDFIEVFDAYEQDKPENEQTRFGRTNRGEWLTVEPSKFKSHYDIDITGKIDNSYVIDLEKEYQLYKRKQKLERIIK